MVKNVAEKARFAALGFSQAFGKDFYETYSLIAIVSIIRILRSLAISNYYQMYKANVHKNC